MKTQVQSYSFALLSVFLAVALRQILDPFLKDIYPFITLYGAIAFSVWIGGYSVGIFAAILGYVACHYLFIEPRYVFTFGNATVVVGFLAYFATAAIIIGFGQKMKNAQSHAEERAQKLIKNGEELRQNVAEFNTLLDILPIGVWIGNHDCTEIKGNPAAYQLFDFPQGINASVTAQTPELPPNLQLLVNGKEVNPEDLPMQYVGRTGQPLVNFEHDIIFPDGRKKSVYGNVAPIFDEQGKVRKVIAAYADFTGHRVAQEILRKQYERAQILSQILEDLFAADDPEKVAREIFPKVAAHLGVETFFNFMVDEKGDALNLHACAGIPEQTMHEIRRIEFNVAICGTVAATRQSIHARDIQNSNYDKADLVRKLGIQTYICNPLIVGTHLLGTLSFASRTRTAFDPDEVEFLRTVTQCVALAMERMRTVQRERTARLAAEESSRLKDEFLATVSHELRTPLNAILGWSHLLQSKSLDSSDFAAINAIYVSAKSQAQIIDDLLDVARIHGGKMRLQPEKISLASVLSAALITINHAVNSKDIQVKMDFRGDSKNIFLYADAHRLQQVFWNLLSNAVKFTPHGGRIEIVVTQTIAEAVISIHDTGSGIKKEFLPFVFQRFRQSDSSSTRKFGGLGLGLAITKELIELHGGTINVESKGENEGSTFIIHLPLTYLHSYISQVEGLPVSDSNSIAYSPKFPGVKILIVDDDKNTLLLLSEAFLETEAEIQIASSAGDGLKIIKRWSPHLLISDIAMPGQDGYWLIDQIRSASTSNSILAIALTAYSSAEVRATVLERGFDVFVPKPMEASEVLRTAEILLQTGTIRNAKPNTPFEQQDDIQSPRVFLGKKILVVEDDLLSSEVMRMTLEKEGFEFRSAAKAAQAMKILQDWIPDIIISDIGLPDEDGYSLIKKIRALPSIQQAATPAIALTGFGKEEGARAIAAGFQLFKNKPIEPKRLLPLLSSLLNPEEA